MRISFLKTDTRKAIKIIDRIMAVVFIVFWGMIAFFLAWNWVEKKHVYPLDYQEVVFEYSDSYGLERALVFATIKVESSFNKNAVSNAGAVGLMQITPTTAEYIARLLNEQDFDLYNENTNVKFGCFYLNYLMQRFSDVDTALCAYNAGEGKVETWLKNKEYSQDGLKLVKIPFKETSEYINKIHRSYQKYKDLYGNILDKKENFE